MPNEIKDFLGSAWRFPPSQDVRGMVELTHQEQAVEQAIRIILMTNQGERQMRPEFGSELYRLQFAPNDATTAGLARRYAHEALMRWEPRIDLLEVKAAPDRVNSARLLIDIRYRIRATNWERNLVFPFYVIPGEEM